MSPKDQSFPEQLACVLNETFSQNGSLFCEVNQSPQPSGLSASPYLPTPAPTPPIQDDGQSSTMNQNPSSPSQSHSFSFALQQLFNNLEPDVTFNSDLNNPIRLKIVKKLLQGKGEAMRL
ncbi:hypothetical protein C8R48DRAFT_775084 [Suillus tomentosus]|nr:hypothetical protein C8R48DRAFT_775084 [Suillus tomentosus]